MATKDLSCIISEIKRDGRKSQFFKLPAFDAPVTEYCHNVWYGKKLRCGYPVVVKKMINSAVSVQYRCVTDRHLAKLRRYSPRYAYASRGKKNINEWCHAPQISPRAPLQGDVTNKLSDKLYRWLCLASFYYTRIFRECWQARAV